MAGWLGFLADTIIPTPGSIFLAAIEGNNRNFLWRDLWVSIMRVIPALLIGSFLGAVTGVVSGRVRLLGETIGPILHIWRALPAVALAPLFIQLFGINETSKIIIIASGVFFPVWVNTHQGAGLVHRTYLDISKSFELSIWSFYRNIVIPSTIPFTIAGIRNGIAMAYIMLFVAEWIGASNGIGYRISIAQGAALLRHRLTTISVVIIFLISRQSYLITLRWPPLEEDCGSFVGGTSPSA
jgi:ABC-type nitrate/sulfonate/bicarbonate transport system permease component